MSFDPIQEDCLRLILQDMRRKRVFPLENAAFIERDMDVYSQDPARLIKTDGDRSFHLTARAAEMVDYRIPFLTDEAEVDRMGDEAESLLREAVELDPANWDARRMLTALVAQSNDAYVSYLLDKRGEVEHDCALMIASSQDPYSREFAAGIGRNPYLRWLSAISSHALICGQYRLALRTAEESLSYAPDDPGDVRHTGMLALAKLEASREELADYRRRHAVSYALPSPRNRRPHPAEKDLDPWSLMAQMSVAYRELDYEGASRTLRLLLKTHPHAAHALFYQAEFPEGVFGRVNVMPGSEDELVLAISESTPLLQEGMGSPDAASFSTWIAQNDAVQDALDRQDERLIPHFGGRSGGEN